MISRVETIVPMLNENECIDEFVERFGNIVKSVPNNIDLSLTIVDDGSEEVFKNKLKEVKNRNSFIKLITLTRNFGHQSAIRAGIDNSSADAVVIIDGDLQDPPELIIQMIESWKNGADHVAMVRKSRKKETALKKFTANLFYKVIDRSSSFDITRNSGDFKLISNWIVKEIQMITEHNLYVRGFVDWLGGNTNYIYYDRDPRFGGDKKYRYSQSIKVALNGLVGLSDFFPKFLNKIFVVSIFGVIFAISWILISLISYPENLVPGWSSIILTLMLILVLQTFSFIFITFYIKKIFEQTSGKKNYSLRKDDLSD